MPSTWYFDGSGTDRHSPVIVLTGLVAADDAWHEFSRRWAAALQDLGLINWHTTDELRKLRAAASGTAAAATPRHSIPAAVLNAALHLADREFQIASFAIDKKALRRLHERYGDEVPDAPRLCVRLCFGALGVCKADVLRSNSLRVFFDRNEPFIRWLKRPWQEHVKEARRAGRGWPIQVTQIEPGTSIEHPGLQAADLVSWAVRVRYDLGDCYADADAACIFVGLLLTGKYCGGFLDHQALHSLCVDKKQPDLRHTYRFS
ncbi:MAG: DUF3800 domain-containing protein [Terriglobia bacterium]